MSQAAHGVSGRERRAFWALLVVWLLGFAIAALGHVRQWQALAAGDLEGLYQSSLTVPALVLLVTAWLLALVLAVRLRRWGWLIACALLIVAIPAFAVVLLVEPQPRRTDARWQGQFQEAMAGGLGNQRAERARGSDDP